MTKFQSVDDNWAAAIQKHVNVMERAYERSVSVRPGDEHDELREAYVNTCHDFLGHIDSVYGSPQSFSDFLKQKAIETFNAANLSTDAVHAYAGWNLIAHEDFLIAEELSQLYEIAYGGFMESVSHHRAFHHASPPPGFNI